MSLRSRIAAAAGGAVALAIVIAAVVIYGGTRSQLRGQIDEALTDRAHQIVAGPGGPRGGPGGPPPSPRGSSSARPGPPPGGSRGGPSRIDPDQGLGLDSGGVPYGGASGAVQLVTMSGRVVRPQGQSARIPVSGRAKRVAAHGSGRYFADEEVGDTHLRVLTVGVGPRGALQVARPLEEVDEVLNEQALLLVLVGAGGIALAVLLGVVVARTALAPISRFTRRTEALTADPNPSERLEVKGRDELARLARSFNATLDALERSVEAQRNLVADASHELRTPIATLRANLQLLREADRLSAADQESLREDMIQELEELTALVGDVVELARGATPSDSLDDVRVDAIVADAVERARRRADDLTLEAKLEPTLVRGQGDRVARAVSNLLDNARKWSPPDGAVVVELKDGILTVRDHGPGFEEADLPHVFDRFYRADEARRTAGSGLGLAIVRHAAEAHGGFAEAANAPGGGALLRVSFGPPLEPPEPEPENAVGARST